MNVLAEAPPPQAAANAVLTKGLAAFVSTVRREGVPDTVRAVLEDAVVDAVGCGLFGLTTEACAIVQGFALDQGGPAEASVWASGGRGRVSLMNAALANGTAIHGFDFDDHSRAKIHPGAAVIPAALAMAERQGADGETFLAAIAAGYEVMNRVSLAANPSASRLKGWHLTGTTGTFAAAAAACVIRGFDARQTAGAFGVAGTQSSGLWAFNADGAMNKRLHPGLAARGGVMAAELVGRGFFGGAHILEAEDGGFLAATSDAPRPAEILAGLGHEWRTEGVCFKPYACCGSNHSSIDAALQLKAEHGFAVDDIEAIVIGVSRVVLVQTGFQYRKTTVLNAQMSIRYDVAVALCDGAALVEQFQPQRLDDPALNALISRVEVVVDPAMDAVYPELYAGIVTIRLKDGREFTRRVDHSRGMPENRMGSEAMEAKFLSLAGAAVGEAQAAALLGELRGIFEAKDVAATALRLGRLCLKPAS